MPTLGKYTLHEELGRGAYAVVWRAEDSRLGRMVALKVLKPGWLEDEMAQARFEREASIAADLYHPQLAVVHEVGEAEGRPYIAMRYVEGQPLDEMLKERGALPWAEALAILEQVASALDYAHGRGLVHRDVKPANIVVSAAEGAVLTDFGLARAIDLAQSVGLTGSAGQVGTPYYRPPELWLGERKAGPPTAATDVYSLACVLVEMVTGKVLFEGDTAAEVMTAHLMEEPALPKTWPPEVPEAVEAAVRQALAKEMADRTASAGEFVGALGEVKASAAAEVEVKARVEIGVQAEASERPPMHPAAEAGQGPAWQQIGIEMVHIPAGEFLLGGDKEKVYLPEYYLGRTPVTNAQYQAFVGATGHEAPWYLESGEMPKGKEDHPVVGVSWEDALGFCDWAGCRLPTEHKWEKGARGTDGRQYPWGDGWEAGHCNTEEAGINDTTPVDRYPRGASHHGLLDMAGNVWEWCQDWYDEDRDTKVVRGGSWSYDRSRARVALRSWSDPGESGNDGGFRCCGS